MMKVAARGADEKFMRAALSEARKGIGRTHPNPAVGAVIVKGGKILAKGWHRGAGQPHAEVEAIRAMKGKPAKGATIYVTLEPCSTQGRTPPCTDAIREAGFSRVVYGATDPNPAHAGRAKKLLTRSGIEVINGVLGEECTAINRDWNKWIVTGLPYVTAKAGMTLDGRISSLPGSRWITSEESRADAMKLRARVDAILVGGETVRADNPKLTLRGIKSGLQPWRVVVTKSGRLPSNAHLFTDEFRDRTLVFKNKPLRRVLEELGKRGVVSVMIEGGGRTLGDAFDHGLVDEVQFYYAPILSGGPTPAVGGKGVKDNEQAIRLVDPAYRKIGPDIRLTARVA